MLALAVLVAPAAGLAQRSTLGVPQVDETIERARAAEAVLELPASSRPANLAEFQVTDRRGLKYFVDTGSLAVTRAGDVRFTLVVRSPSGVDNVSYEGFRCTRREHRIYAVGRADGSWAAIPEQSARSDRVPNKSTNHYSATLFDDYLCPMGIPIGDVAEGLMALRRGGNPRAASTTQP